MAAVPAPPSSKRQSTAIRRYRVPPEFGEHGKSLYCTSPLVRWSRYRELIARSLTERHNALIGVQTMSRKALLTWLLLASLLCVVFYVVGSYYFVGFPFRGWQSLYGFVILNPGFFAPRNPNRPDRARTLLRDYYLAGLRYRDLVALGSARSCLYPPSRALLLRWIIPTLLAVPLTLIFSLSLFVHSSAPSNLEYMGAATVFLLSLGITHALLDAWWHLGRLYNPIMLFSMAYGLELQRLPNWNRRNLKVGLKIAAMILAAITLHWLLMAGLFMMPRFLAGFRPYQVAIPLLTILLLMRGRWIRLMRGYRAKHLRERLRRGQEIMDQMIDAELFNVDEGGQLIRSDA